MTSCRRIGPQKDKTENAALREKTGTKAKLGLIMKGGGGLGKGMWGDRHNVKGNSNQKEF